MKHIAVVALVLAIAGTCSLSGCSMRPQETEAAESSAAASDQPVVKVLSPEVVTLRRQTTQPATVHAYFKADVHAKVSGYLKELKADIGQQVEAGEPLAILSLPEMEKQVERQSQTIQKLKADERRAEAEVNLAQANVDAAVANLEAAKSQVEMAEAQLAADEAEFQRMQDLVNSRSVNERLLDEARKRRDSARASRSAAVATLTSARAQVRVQEARKNAAEADLAVAVAETAVATKQLEELSELMKYTSLEAPFAGTVVFRGVDPGDLVRNSQSVAPPSRPLFTVAQIDKVRIRIAVPERDAPWADEGDLVTVRLAALPGEPVQAKITRIARSLDESTRTMLVEVDVDNPEGKLLPGMYGEATIHLGQKSNALVLPAQAIRFDESGKSTVFVVDGAGTVQQVDVTTGLDDGKQIEVLSGISAQSRVVGSMIGRLQPGQKVQVE